MKAIGIIAIGIGCTGCNVLIGAEEYDAYPDNCGAEAITSARFSFSDEENGHCYSLVRLIQPPDENGDIPSTTFSDAKSQCAAGGGMLACIDDREELELIGKQVTPRTWLGVHTRPHGTQYTCLNGEPFQPNYPAWAEGEPAEDGGECTNLEDGLLVASRCGGGPQHLLCELSP